jgi:hypothetical protein
MGAIECRVTPIAVRYKEATVHASLPRGCQGVLHTLVFHRDDAALAGRPFRHAGREDHVPDLSHCGRQRFVLGYVAVNNLDIVAERAARFFLIACECANPKAIAEQTLDDFGASATCCADHENSLLLLSWIHHARSTMWNNGGWLSRMATDGKSSRGMASGDACRQGKAGSRRVNQTNPLIGASVVTDRREAGIGLAPSFKGFGGIRDRLW